MIYFTTFVLTLLLPHITRATPACGDVASPKELYNHKNADAQEQLTLADEVTWTHKYDNKNGDTKTLACSNWAHLYPHFINIPAYPFIGGTFLTGKEMCGTCWNLTATKTQKTISVFILDSGDRRGLFTTSQEAFKVLNGGPGTSLQATSKKVSTIYCRLEP